MTTHLLGISGALRAASYNTQLVREAARLFAPDTYTHANLRLPLFDEDLEADGIPAEVQTLADQISAADAVVISTPEYNKGLSGVMKNALDWISRTDGAPWLNKPVAILSATAGRAGGERTQWTLRLCLTPFRPRLLTGPEVLIAQCAQQFDDAGRLTNSRYESTLNELMQQLKAEVSR